MPTLVIWFHDCPLGLLCGRRLKSDVRLFVRSCPSVRIFCEFSAIQASLGTHFWGPYTYRRNKSAHFGTLSFFTLLLVDSTKLFFSFFKNCKKVHEWYLEVKCKKSNKWVHFLSVKTSKNTLFLKMISLILRQIDVTQLFRLFHTRAPRGHPTLWV